MLVLIFVCAMLLGLMFLMIALTIWLSEILRSVFLALLIVGIALLVVAAVIYLCSLRWRMERLRQNVDMLWSVSAIVERAYQRLRLIVKLIMGNS